MRDVIIRDYGIEVIRFTNEEIENNLDGVFMELERIIEEKEKLYQV